MVRSHRLSRAFYILLALVRLTTTARTDNKWPNPLGPSHEPNPFHYDAKL